MKKPILFLLVVFSLGTLAAQTTPTATKTVQVPSAVSKRFTTDYPNTTPTWTMAGTTYRSEYKDPNNMMRRAVLYDKDGKQLGTEKEMGQGEYPVAINDYFLATYPKEAYQVWVREESTGKRAYFIPRTSDIIWFDDKGTYTTKVSRTPAM